MEQNSEKVMSFEEIEAHVKTSNIEQFNKPQAPGAAGAQQDLAGQLQRVCGVYRTIRPILQAVINFPLIPGSIKTPIKTFMTVMNTICP